MQTLAEAPATSPPPAEGCRSAGLLTVDGCRWHYITTHIEVGKEVKIVEGCEIKLYIYK